MYRFVHTADWQMGMMACGLGSAAEKVRAARVEALGNIFAAAEGRGAQAVLVAGDLFESNQVAPGVVEQVLGVLNDRTRLPVYLIPGNHDPYTRDSVYRRKVWGQLRPGIQVLCAPEPVVLAEGVTLFPCPLLARNGVNDPTACIPARNGDSGLRIGLAHGTMRIRDGVGDDDFPIPLDAAPRRGLDFLAMGHWHSTLCHPVGGPEARVYYSGTHECTSFGERDSGNSLLVTLDGPGRPPQVETIHTGTLCWEERTIDLAQRTLAQAAQELRQRPGADRCLLKLRLQGPLRPEDAAGLGEFEAMLGARFLYAQIDEGSLRPADGEALDSLLSLPYLRDSAAKLRALAQGPEGEDREAARRALTLLEQAAWECR